MDWVAVPRMVRKGISGRELLIKDPPVNKVVSQVGTSERNTPGRE